MKDLEKLYPGRFPHATFRPVNGHPHWEIASTDLATRTVILERRFWIQRRPVTVFLNVSQDLYWDYVENWRLLPCQ